MPKIGVIARSERDFERDSKLEMNKVFRSTNPMIHKFQKAREYQRAVVGAKIEKIFAHPFVASMNEHSDGITAFAKSARHVTRFASGDFSGELRFWDLNTKKSLFSI